MSGGGWDKIKDNGLLYKIVKQDSRNAAWLGNAIGGKVGDYIEQEGKKNVENPGRAITKAAITAATWYLGNYGADAFGAGAGGAAATGAEAGAGAAGGAAGATAMTAEELAAQQAAQAALQGYIPAAEADSLAVGQGLLGSGAPVTDLSTNAVQVLDRSTQAGLLDKARLAFTSGSGTSAGGKQLAMQMGAQAMQPQQRPQPMAPPPRQQGPIEPLPRSYNQGPYGTSSGNSMGLLTPEEERKRRLLMMRGY